MNSLTRCIFLLWVFAATGTVLADAGPCDFGVTAPEQPVDMLQGSFTRDSIAFLDGKSYKPHAPRRRIMAASSPSDFEFVTSGNVIGGGTISPRVHCISGGYIWATSAAKTGLYKSADGENWIRVQSDAALTGIDAIFPHSSGAIFVVGTESFWKKLYRSQDGSDLTDAHMPPAKISFSTPTKVCTATYFNYHEARNGTICIGNYQALGGCRSLWRSGDGGETFQLIYTEADPNVKHSHRVYKQEALGRWVAAWGDGGNFNKVTFSDDDGLTWADLEANADNHFQPVEFYDYGHPTRLLYGSDASNSFGFYDAVTAQIEPLYWEGPSLDGTRYCWGITHYDGIFYSSILNMPSIPAESRRASIIISDDLAHWDIYHQFGDECGVYFIMGVLNNKIHCIIWTASGIFQYGRFTPAAVRSYNALCIDPATTNLLSANASSMETDTSAWACSGTKTSFSAEALNGSKCLHCNSSVYGDVLRFANSYGGIVPGELYSGRVAMKGYQSNQSGSFYWALSGSGRSDTRQHFGLGREQWQDLPLNPLTIMEGDTSLAIYIKGYYVGGTNIPNPTDLLLDCAQLERGAPTRWQLGGTPRASEVLSKSLSFPNEWTEHIIWAPATRLDYFLPAWGNQYIKSWFKDPNNFIELFYDPVDSKFKLQVTADNMPQTPIVTSRAYNCYTNASVRLVVRAGDQFRLSVNYAGWEHLGGPDAFTGIVGSKTGNYAGNNVISGSYLSDLLYSYYMSNKRIELEAGSLNHSTDIWNYIPAGDANGDYRVDMFDLALLAVNWMADCRDR